MKQNTTITVLFLFVFCFLTNINAQNIAVEQDRACINCPDFTADPSAALEVRASDKGVLVPRVTNTSAISNPAEGLVIYDNSDDYFKYYDGSEWQSMGLKHISFPVSANTFVGVQAGASNTTGFSNSAIGWNALSSNTTGSQNTANGNRALYSNTIGILNTAIGLVALSNNTEGTDNTAIGAGALTANTTGFSNTAVGRVTLLSNTTGDINTAVGRGALNSNTTGNYNTAVGWAALINNTTGSDNTAIGRYSLDFNTTGGSNSAVGYQALYSNTIGNFNTAVGRRAFYTDSTYSNSTALGYQAQPTGSNQVRLGNSDVTSVGGYANWSNVSDARFKTQVQADVPGLAFISLLSPVTYQMDMDAIAKFHDTPEDLRLADSERAKAAIRYTGFLAQDVEKAAESVGYDFSGVDKPRYERDNYSLRYAEFVVPLVKAVQELEQDKKALQHKNADLEARLSKIEALLNEVVSGDEN